MGRGRGLSTGQRRAVLPAVRNGHPSTQKVVFLCVMESCSLGFLVFFFLFFPAGLRIRLSAVWPLPLLSPVSLASYNSPEPAADHLGTWEKAACPRVRVMLPRN